MRTLLLAVQVSANRVTCGGCTYLRRSPSTYSSSKEWWCSLFNISRGLVGAQKTPNRAQLCIDAEARFEREALPIRA